MIKREPFIDTLENGAVEFYTRHQEEEWGCRYLGGGWFLKWSRNACEGRYTEELLTEAEVRRIFAGYSLERLLASLVKRGALP